MNANLPWTDPAHLDSRAAIGASVPGPRTPSVHRHTVITFDSSLPHREWDRRVKKRSAIAASARNGIKSGPN
jgi:hypothetical protein